ncbi:uncharacterized protein LOC107416995 [Ziziphus jujuba]|uniref:Uncharacterized protein LOC107416995 n=2 Tax=Ziziphus jujuba TaxID=326968 RepID=A0A6P3ZP26_ZIZJJ|nr:uncharacterized protein LOC107416995 [Ziziphus jujuba]KAH7533446.1 hypothetical protein FEM48_Zijuj04G0131400 [Ziziphus jujuba var. spinosa]
MMGRVLGSLRQNFQNIGKSPRVADESMYGGVGGGGGGNIEIMERRRSGWKGFLIVYSVVRAPFSLFSCFSHPHVNGADGVWASGEFAQISEMNHLMVSDSMRYAILM